MNRVHAPFALEQVVALNAYQRAGAFHPFTCAHQGNAKHPGDETKLVATAEGWRCPHCAYTQVWAPAFMAVPACQDCGVSGEPLTMADDLSIRCAACADV